MTGSAGRRVWGLLSAALATLLLVLAPAGHAKAADPGQATSAVLVAAAHDNDTVAVTPSSHATVSRTASSSADADLTRSDGSPTPWSEGATTDRSDPAAQVVSSVVSARAPPLKA